MRLRGLGLSLARTLILGGNRLGFHFSVTPFAGGRTYKLITMDKGGIHPEAFVLSPDLRELAGGERLPHIYGSSGTRTKLCLHLPGSGEWSRELLLSETFVPWTVEWLRFFELWLVGGIAAAIPLGGFVGFGRGAPRR